MDEYIRRVDAINAMTEEAIVRNMDTAGDSAMARVARSSQRILAALPTVKVRDNEQGDMKMYRRYLFHLYDGSLETIEARTLKEALKERFGIASINYSYYSGDTYLDADIIEKCLTGFADNEYAMIYLYNALIEKIGEDYKIMYATTIEAEIYNSEGVK